MPLVLEAPGFEPQNFGLRIKTLADILECLVGLNFKQTKLTRLKF
jgi:hypothetical protein